MSARQGNLSLFHLAIHQADDAQDDELVVFPQIPFQGISEYPYQRPDRRLDYIDAPLRPEDHGHD
jgi:hypothetical protein